MRTIKLVCLIFLLALNNSYSATISVGNSNGIAFRTDGLVVTWGKNSYGQLGNGTTNSATTPVLANLISNSTAVASGSNFSLAITNGQVMGWGSNYYGQLGDGTTTSSSTPVISSFLNSGVTAISAGSDHGVAIKDGQVWAWGNNYSGQLGDGTTKSSAPKAISTVTGTVTAIAAGDGFTLALTSDGIVWAWGNNSYGQIGTGANNTYQILVPAKVLGLTNVTALAAGASHAVALKSDGSVWTWGRNNYCQLGASQSSYGSCSNSAVPVQVTSISGVKAVAAGDRHTVALKTDGTVWGWGSNSLGQLGCGSSSGCDIPSYGYYNYTPIQAVGLSNVTAIAAGGNNTLAVTSDQSVFSWGDNSSGQLGYFSTPSNGSYSNHVNTPSKVSGLGGLGYLNLAGTNTATNTTCTSTTPPSTTPTTTSTADYTASFSAADSTVNIPRLSVNTDIGNLYYNVTLSLQPIVSPMTFTLKSAVPTK